MKQVLSVIKKSFGLVCIFVLSRSYSGPDVPVVELPEVVPYFDLEGFAGVTELRRVKDANSEPIIIPLGLLFGDRIVTTAYVRMYIVGCYLTTLQHPESLVFVFLVSFL